MTKKDFDLVAEIMKRRIDSVDPADTRTINTLCRLAEDFADEFEVINTNFNRQQFLKACGTHDE